MSMLDTYFICLHFLLFWCIVENIKKFYVPIEAHKEPHHMSSNPENFPGSSTGNAGSNPNDNPAHIQGTPYDKTSMKEAIDQEKLAENVDTDTLHLVASDQYTGGRTPFREQLPTPEVEKKKSKKGLLIGLGAAAATGLTLVGAWVGATGNGFLKPGGNANLPPEPEQTAGAPIAPGVTEPTAEATPTQTVERPVEPVVASPEHIENYDELVESSKMTFEKYDGQPAAYDGFVSQFNKMINFQPTDEMLEKSKNLVSSETGAVGPEALLEVYQSAFTDMFSVKGSTYSTLSEIGKDTFNKWQLTKENGDERPYELWFETTEDNHLIFRDNSYENSLPDDPISAVYTIPGQITVKEEPFGDDNIDNRQYLFPGNAEFVKLGEVSNEPGSQNTSN